MNPMAFQEAISNNYRNSCKVDQDNDKNFTVICDYEHVFEVKVNAADLVGLRQLASSYVLFLSIYTSYSVDGLEKFIEANKTRTMTEQQQHEFLKNQMPLAGKLLSNHSLTTIPDLGSDYLAAARWVTQYQSQLCPTVNNPNSRLNPSKEHRPGYLFKDDQFCVKDTNKANADLNLLEMALKGPIDVVLDRKDLAPVSTKVDYYALVKNPIQDIRELAPTSYSSCGKAETLKDKTLGGTFPSGDAETFVIEKCR